MKNIVKKMSNETMFITFFGVKLNKDNRFQNIFRNKFSRAHLIHNLVVSWSYAA